MALDGKVRGTYRVGDAPVAIVFSEYHGAGHVWVANLADDTVMKLTLDGHRLAVVRTGKRPSGLAIYGDTLIVANSGSRTLSRVSLATGGASKM
jgi:DNA-binding beta-propeller fold protein YncE